MINTKYGSGGTDNKGEQPTLMPKAWMPATAHDVAARYRMTVVARDDEMEPWVNRIMEALGTSLPPGWTLVASEAFEDDLGLQYPWFRIVNLQNPTIGQEPLEVYNEPQWVRAFKQIRKEVVKNIGLVPANIKFQQFYCGSLFADFVLHNIGNAKSGKAGTSTGEKYVIPIPKFTVKAESSGDGQSNNDRFIRFESEMKVRQGFYLRRPLTIEWQAEVRIADFEVHVNNSHNQTAMLAYHEASSGPIKQDIKRDKKGVFEEFLAAFDKIYARLIGYSLEACKLAVNAAMGALEYDQGPSVFVPTSVMAYLSHARPLVSRMQELGIVEALGGLEGFTVGSTLLAAEQQKVRCFDPLFKRLDTLIWANVKNMKELYDYLEELIQARKAWAAYQGYDAEDILKQSGAALDTSTPRRPNPNKQLLDCRYCAKLGKPANHDWVECKKARGEWKDTVTPKDHTGGVKPKGGGAGAAADAGAKKKAKTTKSKARRARAAATKKEKLAAAANEAGLGKGDRFAATQGKKLTPPEHQCVNVFPDAAGRHAAFHHVNEKWYKDAWFASKGSAPKWVPCVHTTGCTMHHPEICPEVLKKSGITDVRTICANHVAWTEKWNPKPDQKPCMVSVRKAGAM